MKVTIDTTRWFEAMESWFKMCQHQAAKPSSSKANKLYYELYAKYYERLIPAIEKGNIIVHPTSVPTEIFYAMDLVPMLVTSSTWQMVYSMKNFDEVLGIAKDFGLMEETCSVHRMIAAFAFKGWFPKPVAFVYAVGGCDAFCGSSRVLSEFYDTPSFCIDTPYYYTEEGIAYLTQELADMVAFLEGHTGRRMDWDRLRQSLKLSQRQMELYQEIRQLRKAVPSPMENRRAWQLNWMNWIYAGSEDGIHFFQTLRDELKERVENKKGVASQEKFRLLDLQMPPAWAFKLLDWMQEERGANIVSESYIRYERDVILDPDKPMESLARKWCGGPLWNELQGSTRVITQVAVEDAKEYQVDGAIWWDNFSCRQCGALRMTRDTVLEEVNIPVAEVKCDVMYPGFVSYEEMQKSLENFFDLLEDRKRG
jgi:benzoyl-CoA reductase/2-hydroxyglutaryl-CoA dehydratase subunit BcrC/BadD/HgdB